jgi:hypothetical protein
MKLFRWFFKENKKDSGRQNIKEESLMKFGREQFKTLAKKGLSVPIVLL